MSAKRRRVLRQTQLCVACPCRSTINMGADMKLILLATTVVMLSVSIALAKGKVVECAISSLPGNEVQFRGKCSFTPEQGGSFTLMHVSGRGTFYGFVGAVSVFLTGKTLLKSAGWSWTRAAVILRAGALQNAHGWTGHAGMVVTSVSVPGEVLDNKKGRLALVVFLTILVGLSLAFDFPLVTSGSLMAWDEWAVFLLMWAPGVAGLITSLALYRSFRPLGFLGNRWVLALSVFWLALPLLYTLVIYPTLNCTCTSRGAC